MSSRSIQCPIWGTPAVELPGYGGRDGIGVDSPRAGGRFFISRSAEENLQHADEVLKVKITHEIVDHNALASVPEILTTTIEGLSKVSLPRPQERAERILRYFVLNSIHLGQKFDNFSRKEMHPESRFAVFIEKITDESLPLFAWSDSVREDEVVFILEMLAESGDILISTDKPIPNVTVLPKGYDRVQTVAGDIQLDQAFIAMWFDASMAEAYEFGIEAAVRESGYKPLRIDQKEHVNKIDDEIIAEIRRSRFLIADFTAQRDSPRGGVYFEAGFAFALEKPVIWCCRSDLIDQVHFDTRQFNHIVWSNPADLKERLKNRIGAILGSGPFRQS